MRPSIMIYDGSRSSASSCSYVVGGERGTVEGLAYMIQSYQPLATRVEHERPIVRMGQLDLQSITDNEAVVVVVGR